jgi:hypothetical protein
MRIGPGRSRGPSSRRPPVPVDDPAVAEVMVNPLSFGNRPGPRLRSLVLIPIPPCLARTGIAQIERKRGRPSPAEEAGGPAATRRPDSAISACQKGWQPPRYPRTRPPGVIEKSHKSGICSRRPVRERPVQPPRLACQPNPKVARAPIR